MKSNPPKLFLRFFRWYCHPKLRSHIEGDLVELYGVRVRESGKRRADIKFIIDVILLCRPGIVMPFRSAKSPRRNSTKNFMFINYFKVAFRNMVKQKAYNILNILGLSIGICSGLIIAMHIRHELSFEKEFVNYENIYRVHRDGWAASSPVLASEFEGYFPEVEAIGRFTPYGIGPRVVNTDRNNPGEATGYCADPTVLRIFDLKVVDGDPNPLTALSTAVITKEMAKRYFGNGSAIGKILTIDNDVEIPVTAVVENLPHNSHLKFDFLVSMSTFYHEREWADQNRGWMTMYTYALLRPGGIDNVSERMPQFIRKYYSGDPDVEQEVAAGGWRLMPLKDIHLYSNLEKEMTPNSSIIYVYIFTAVELLILIVASANFMSLFTTQALRRVKEAGMRKILGARPGQLSIQFLTEVMLLVSVSAFLAVIFYQLALPFYNHISGKSLGTWEFLEPDSVATIGVMLLVVIAISGLYPSLFIARFKPNAYLREGKLPASMPNLIRSGLVVFQFLVSVSLIAAAIIVRQQMVMMKNKDLGFERDQVVNVKLYGDLLRKAYDTETFSNEFLSNPDILALGRTDRLIGERLSIESVAPVGHGEEELPDIRVLRVDEGYLEAMNIEVAEGRNFSRKFNDSTAFIINESAAKALGLANPVGEVLNNQTNGPRKGQIVGVVEDYHFASLHAEIEPLVIEFKPEWTDNFVLKIRAGKTRESLDYIENTVNRLAPNSLFIYDFLDDRVDALYRSENTMGKVFQFFSVLAIVIACLGLVGLSSYTIETRTKEIGIRKVLGATVTAVVALVSARILRLILIGFLIAVPVTWFAMNRWLDNFAYKIEIEWWVFALTGAIVILIAALAIGVRTIRAAIANPVNSLRNE